MPADPDQVVWGADLGLFYSGLFNFYQYAAYDNKKQFLKIIQEQMLKLKKELLVSLPGFMLCMLPALDDQNSEMTKQVELILAETEKIVGTSKFFGEIWKCMLRTPRCRVSAIKYLAKKIPKTPQLAQEVCRAGRLYLTPYHMTIKLGRAVIENDNTVSPTWYAREMSMQSELSLTGSNESYFYFYYPNKEVMVNNALLAGLSTLNQTVYVNRAVLDFLVSHMPITSAVNTDQESINLMEGALMTLVKKDFASLKKFFFWFIEHLSYSNKKAESNDPSIRFVNPALKTIFKKFYKVQTDAKITINEQGVQVKDLWTISTPILIFMNLVSDNLPTIAEPILTEISVDLIKYIQHFYKPDESDQQHREQIQKFSGACANLFQMIAEYMHCVYQALSKLLQEEISVIVNSEHLNEKFTMESISLITFCIRDLNKIMEGSATKWKDDKKNEMVTPILSGLLSGVAKLSDSEQYAIPALKLIEEILDMLQDSTKIDSLNESVMIFNQFYITISMQQQQLASVSQLQYAVFKISSDILFKIQRYADAETFLLNVDWFKHVVQCSCGLTSDNKSLLVSNKLLLVSIEVFLNIFQEFQESGGNLRQLESLIQEESQKKIVTTLWSRLDLAEDHERIVQLLKRMDKLMPKIFSEVITADIVDNDRDVKLRAVTKFSIFWKLTAADLDYKPFEPISERFQNSLSERSNERLLPHLTRSTSLFNSQDEERAYNALHKMLEILEDKDPTMRLSCRSWLSESKRDYHRILDPLLVEFMENKKLLVSFTGQCFFMENYNATIVIENFGKLRNIILNTQDELIKYVVTQDTSSYIKEKGKLPVDYKTNLQEHLRKMELKLSNGKYIQAIVYITLQFIMGQAVQSLSPEIYQKTHTVNSSAAEFMELILKSLQPYKDLAHEVAHVIVNPIVRTLRQSIENRNVAQQVHLLNLLKVILFECNFSNKVQNKNIQDHQFTKVNIDNLFKDTLFITCIRDGMLNAKTSFVRNAFIQFAEVVLPFIQGILKPEEMKPHATMMLQCYCSLLKMIDVSGFQNTNLKALKLKQIERKFLISQETDIVTIVKGLENLLGHCLGITREKDINEEIEDQLKDLKGANQNDKSGGWLWFGGGGKEVLAPSDPNENLKKEIWGAENTKNLLLSCLQIWNDLDLFYTRDFYFTRLGIFPYNNQDDQAMSKHLSDLSKEKLEHTVRAAQAIKQTKTAEPTLPELSVFINSYLNNIQKTLIDMLEPISRVYVNQIIDGFLEIWRFSGAWSKTDIQVGQGCDRIIQLLICLKIEPYKVIEAVNRWIVKNNQICQKEKKQFELNKKNKDEFCLLQSLTCQFVYVFFVQQIQNHFKRDKANYLDKLTQLYKHTAQFIRNFYHTKHPSTILWLLEIMFILQNKFRPDDNKVDKKMKYEFHELLDTLLKASADVITDQFNVKYNTDYGFDGVVLNPTVYEFLKRYQFIRQKDLLNLKKLPSQVKGTRDYLKFDQKTLESFEELPFQKESIFLDIEQVRKARKQKSGKNELSKFFRDMYQNLQYKEDSTRQTDSMHQQEVYKFFTVLTLKQILFPLIQSIYQTEETDKSLLSLSIIVDSVMKILGVQIKQVIEDHGQALSEKEERNKIQSEVFSDFLAGLTHKNTILQKQYKFEITAIFNSENFFMLSKRTLRKWQQIMRNFMSNDINNEVFDDLLLKFNKVEGLFVSKKWEISQKSLTFKRLAFLVYSSNINSLGVTQLDLLLKKMTEGFKNANKDSEMQQQLFLLSRILMVRLETTQLAEALRKLWPHLLNELVNVFDCNGKKVDYLLQIEGIKIVELMSQLNIEDFQMNQWMFLFDGYGLQIDENKEQIEVRKNLALKNNHGFELIKANAANEVFQPYLVKFICNKTAFDDNEIDKIKMKDTHQINTYMVDKSLIPFLVPTEGPNPARYRTTTFQAPKKFKGMKEEIILEDCAFEYAFKLQQSLTDANVVRTEIDRRNAEVLIEKDFLNKPRN